MLCFFFHFFAAGQADRLTEQMVNGYLASAENAPLRGTGDDDLTALGAEFDGIANLNTAALTHLLRDNDTTERIDRTHDAFVFQVEFTPFLPKFTFFSLTELPRKVKGMNVKILHGVAFTPFSLPT